MDIIQEKQIKEMVSIMNKATEMCRTTECKDCIGYQKGGDCQRYLFASYLLNEYISKAYVLKEEYKELKDSYNHLRGSIELIGKIQQTEDNNDRL